MIPLSSNATHYMGGNINYQCIGPEQYTVFVSIFRDCNGLTFDPTLDILVESATCNINTTYSAQLVSSYPEVVTPICPGEPDVCLTSSGTYGVEYYLYKIVITIPDGCPDVIMSSSDCCRNDAITTLNTPGGDGIFVYTTLDTQESPCNTSPAFSEDLTPFICLGDNVTFNQFAFDPDGDELVFSLTSCLDDGLNNAVSYINPPYNATNPLNSSTPITIDPATGLINFTPTALDVGVLCVLVEEFRNGVKISETIRDLQFTVINCPANDPPVLSGFDGLADATGVTGDYQLNVCWDEQLCYDIETFDMNNHNVELSFVTNTTGVTFTTTANNTTFASAQLCWTPSIDDLGLNYFIITATDDACPVRNSNTFTYTISVEAEDYLDFAYVQDSVNCIGGSDGSATITLTNPSGLSPNPILTWLTEPSQTGFTGTNLSVGTYNVLLEDDSLDCPGIMEVEILEPTEITLSLGPAFQSIDCTIGNDGIMDVTAVGGTPDYTYEWSNGAMTQVNPNLLPGTYTVTVSDFYGCTASTFFYLQSNSDLIITALTSNYGGYNVSCNGYSDGSINLFVALGVPPYTFAWSNGATTEDLDNIPAGDYVVTVTDAQGCIRITNRTLDEPPGFVTSTNVTDATCAGLGTISISAGGAPLPYTYQWTNGVSTSNEAFDLTGGTYTCTITDGNGCTTTLSEVISSAGSMTINQGPSSSDVSCFGSSDGVLEVQQIGGVNPITYAWSNSGTMASINNLIADSYTVTVSDGSGCVSTAEYIVSEPTALQITSTTSDYNSYGVSCFGSTDGTITTTTTGGASPYTFAWDNGEITSDLNNLAAGFYTITISDANSCTTSSTIEITTPSELTSSMAVGGANCNGGGDGTATVTPSGGVVTYTYLWSDNQMTATAIGLMAQTYTVTVTDDVGCTTTNFIDVADPPILSVSTTGTGASCFGGSDGTVTALANGGAGGYSYTWSIPAVGDMQTGLSAGTYTVTVTDANGCTAENPVTIGEASDITVSQVSTNVSCAGGSDGSIDITVSGGSAPYVFAWSDGSNGEDCLGVPLGTYTVSITDANGCTYSDSYTLIEPTPIDILLTPTDALCIMGNDGAINATISGGTMPYTYVWSNSEITKDIANLSALDYTITVTDFNGCTTTSQTTVSEPSTGISVVMSPDPTICFGDTNGSANAIPSGGAGGYTYSWSDSNNTATASNLGSGIFTVTVSDLNSCTTTGTVNVNELTDINIVLTSITASCDNGNDGTATITNISGGTGSLITDYNISWATIPIQNTVTATGLLAGQSYSVTVTDVQGCTGTNSVTLSNPNPIGVNLVNAVPVSCSGESDGSVTVIGAGGSSPYNYSWSDGQTMAQAIDLSLGTYTVTVTDAGNCTITASYVVDNPTMLDVSIAGINATCKGWANGAATATATGGVPPYSYLWSDGQIVQSADFLASGNYNVTVTDANSCMVAASVYVGEPDWLSQVPSVVDVTCNGDRDGSIMLLGSGGTPPYMYSFDGGNTFDNSDTNFALYPGEYGVAVQDANGCTTLVDTVEVGEPLPLEVIIYPLGPIVNYNLDDSIQLSVAIANNIGNASIQWTALYGEQDMSCTDCAFPWITGQENNRFEVTVTDANGCVGTAEIEVVVNRNREIFVPGAFTPNNDGINDYLMVHGSSGTIIQSFRVYDRWGELVFQAEDYDINSEDPLLVWDGSFKGKEMNSDVFVWYLEVLYSDGREEAFEGSSSLMR